MTQPVRMNLNGVEVPDTYLIWSGNAFGLDRDDDLIVGSIDGDTGGVDPESWGEPDYTFLPPELNAALRTIRFALQDMLRQMPPVLPSS